VRIIAFLVDFRHILATFRLKSGLFYPCFDPIRPLAVPSDSRMMAGFGWSWGKCVLGRSIPSDLLTEGSCLSTTFRSIHHASERTVGRSCVHPAVGMRQEGHWVRFGKPPCWDRWVRFSRLVSELRVVWKNGRPSRMRCLQRRDLSHSGKIGNMEIIGFVLENE
jgi:hypothetical protein